MTRPGERVLEAGLAELYARALVAVCRADDEIGIEEGQRLAQRLEQRTGGPVRLDDLLLEEPLEPRQLAEAVRASAGPFRGASLHPGELARLFVTDAIEVVLAKGHVSEAEANQIARFATALGSSLDELEALSPHLAAWLPAGRAPR